MTSFRRQDPYTKKRATYNKDKAASQSEKPSVPKVWSLFQQNIFDDIVKGTGHTVVMARAGSGKTTVLEECAKRVPRYKSVLMCAFNVPIKDELKKRIQLPNVEISTLHGFGYKSIIKSFGRGVNIDKEKAKKIAEAKIPNHEDNNELVMNLMKAVSLAKGYLAESVVEIDEVLDKHGVEFGKEITRNNFISKVQECLADHLQTYKQTGRIDFDDMIWIPTKLELPVDKFDMVFIDETQDLNLCQIYLALDAIVDGGRIIAVGDDRQAIYGFRGAAADAVEVVKSTLKAKVLPLSITYRCAKKIVELAQAIVPDFQAADNAIDGHLFDVTTEEMLTTVKGGDFILSRKNAPLMNLCMRFIKEGRKANIQGRDFGKNLIWTINRSECKNVQDFLDYIENWGETECDRLAKKKRDNSYVKDKVECFQIICEGATSLKEVVDRINKVFSDETGDSMIVLSSVHKAKGLERDRVFLLGNTFNLGKNAEEDNLWYVAVTRARQELYIVLDEKKG